MNKFYVCEGYNIQTQVIKFFDFVYQELFELALDLNCFDFLRLKKYIIYKFLFFCILV